MQILMWTLLVIFALCYVWVANGILLGVLALLGISGTTSVLARTVEGYGNKPQDTWPREPKLKIWWCRRTASPICCASRC
jgi:hypothetical protein